MHAPSTPALAASCCLLAAATARADEPTDAVARQRALEHPRSSFITDNPPAIELEGQIQFRYQANLRDDPGPGPSDDATVGFLLRRTKIAGKVRVAENLSAKFQLAADRRTGTFEIEVAQIDWKLGDRLSLRAGQFKVPLLREALVSSKRQLAAERSAVHAEFSQNYSQAVELNYRQDRFRAALAISDGLSTANTAFTSPAEADLALTARAEVLLGQADFKAFDQFTSFRGATGGAMLGLAAHWQTTGDTNPSAAASADLAELTADLSFVGN
jgi:phosphate-selective porin